MVYKVPTLFVVMLLFTLFVIAAVPFYSGDVKNHLAWAQSLLDHGALGFYEREFAGFAFPNYPPLMMGLFVLSLKLYQLVNQLAWWLNLHLSVFPSRLIFFLQWENTKVAFLKLPAILANFGTAWVLWLITRKKIAALLFLLNPAAFYLSIVWGQVDMLPVMFLFWAVYFLFREAKFLSILMLLLALMSKQTVLIFIPIFLFIYSKKFRIKWLSLSVVELFTLFYVFYLPFHSFSLWWAPSLFRLNFELVAHSVSEGALNIWSFIVGFRRISDERLVFLSLTYQQLGYLAFFGLMSLPTLKFIQTRINIKTTLSFIFLTTITFFLVLTRMHERYLAPATAVLSALVIFDKKYWLALAFFSFLYLINLYRDLFQPSIVSLGFVLTNYVFLKTIIIIYIVVAGYYLYNFFKND